MRKTYNLKDVNIGKLHDAVNLLAIDGFAGISIDTGIHMEFPDRESLTKTEQKKLDTLMESYVDPVYIEDVRKMREPLLEEADWRFNKAVDNDEQDMVNAIKLYRNQLRDMTKQELNNLIWPNKPWEQ
jgi:hypothetical protein